MREDEKWHGNEGVERGDVVWEITWPFAENFAQCASLWGRLITWGMLGFFLRESWIEIVAVVAHCFCYVLVVNQWAALPAIVPGGMGRAWGWPPSTKAQSKWCAWQCCQCRDVLTIQCDTIVFQQFTCKPGPLHCRGRHPGNNERSPRPLCPINLQELASITDNAFVNHGLCVVFSAAAVRLQWAGAREGIPECPSPVEQCREWCTQCYNHITPS